MHRKRVIALLSVALLGVVAGLAWLADGYSETARPAAIILELPRANAASPLLDDPDFAMRAEPSVSRFVGTWQREKHGQRTLNVQPDGTARMTVLPERVWAFVVGDRVDVEITWELRDDVLSVAITGGRPSKSLEAVKRLWGETWTRTVVEISPTKLVLRDEGDGSLEEWHRLPGGSGE